MTLRIPVVVFKEALAQFASGVTVVAAESAAGPVGVTVTGFTSVSLEPPLVLVCVGKSASAHDGLCSAQSFAVSVLAEGQSRLASQFAASGVDRFAGVPLAPPGPTGAPRIGGAIAWIECRHQTTHDAGDHTMLIGEVVDTVASPGRPLLHFARRFARLAEAEP